MEFWKASLQRILSFGFGLQVQSGDVFGLWASRLTVGVSGIEGSADEALDFYEGLGIRMRALDFL